MLQHSSTHTVYEQQSKEENVEMRIKTLILPKRSRKNVTKSYYYKGLPKETSQQQDAKAVLFSWRTTHALSILLSCS